MARVPVPNVGAGTALQPLPSQHLQVVNATEGVTTAGHALEQAGQFGFQYADEQDRIDQTLDRAAVRAADNRASKTIRERMWTGDNAFYSLQGFNAANARDGVEAGFGTLREEILGTLTTDRQRETFRDIFDRRVGAEEEGIARHVRTEVTREEEHQSTARIGEASNNAVTHWADPVAREADIQTALGEVRSRAETAGWAPDTLRTAEIDVRSGITYRAGNAMLDRGDIEGAQHLVNENRGILNPDHEAALDALLRGPLLDREGVAAALTVLGEHVPAEAVAGAQPNAAGHTPPTGAPAAVGAQLRAGGIPPVVVAGFLGNIHTESGFQTSGPSGDGGTSHGLIQLHSPERIANFRRVIGVDVRGASLEQQTRFILWEMQHPAEAGMTVAQRDQILRARTPEEAARLIDQHYERSDGTARNQRAATARSYYNGNGPDSAGPRPQEHDLAQLMTRLEAMHLPFDVEQRARRELISRVGLDEQLLTRQREAAQEEAWATVERLGDRFTSVDQLPASVRSRLTPQQRLQFDAVGERNANQSHPTNWQQFSRYSDMYATDPAGFARINPAELRANLGNSEFETVMGWRRDVQVDGQAGTRPTPAQVSHERVRSVTDPMLQAAGIMRPPESLNATRGRTPTTQAQVAERYNAYYQRIGQFQRNVNADVERWRQAHPNAQMSDNDIQDIADRQLMTVWRRGAPETEPGHHEGEVFSFERAPGVDYQTVIPRGDSAQIRQVYRQRWGREPTRDEIYEIYRYGPIHGGGR